MARPKRYDDDRIETKVRLRRDHHAKLQAMTDHDPSVSRNRIVEEALDQFFSRKAPRMPTPDPAARIGKPPASPGSRVTPRVQSVGEAHEAQARANGPGSPVVKEPPSRARPRRPYR